MHRLGAAQVGRVRPGGQQRLVLGYVFSGIGKWPHPQQPSASGAGPGTLPGSGPLSRRYRPTSAVSVAAVGRPYPNWRNERIQGTMVRAAAICDPEGGLLEEARALESPPVQRDQTQRDQTLADQTLAGQPEWNLPTWEDIVRTHSARVYRL